MNLIEFIRQNRKYFEDITTRSTYHSNAIEGNTLSYAETYAVIFNDNSFTVKAQPREIYEAINHKYAFGKMLDFAELGELLTQKMIVETAVMINKNISEISGFRTTQVFIQNAEFIPPPPASIPQEMMYFIHNYNTAVYETVFDKIADFHIRFERIHPFSDGNGRTGRILLNFELLKNNIAPIVIPKDSRSDYFKLLAEQDSIGLARFFEELSQAERQRIDIFLQAQLEEEQEQ